MKINIEQNIYRPLEKMNPFVLPAAISAGASIISGIAGMIGQSDANKRNYQQQLALLQNQQQFTREMWEKQTQENRQSIINQMSQYRQLGVNPLAVTGGVQQSNQTAPSAPSAPQANYRNPMEGAQFAVIMSEALKNIAEAKKTEAEVPKVEAETAYTWSQQKTEEALREKRISIAGIEVQLGASKVRLTDEQTKEVTQHIENLVSEKQRVDSAIQNERLLAYDDYMRSVDAWLHNRRTEQHWTTQEAQEWRNIAIRNYDVQIQAQNVKSLIEQRQHMNALSDAQKAQVEAETEKTRKECEKLGLDVDFERRTLTYRVNASNQQYQAIIDLSTLSSEQSALQIEWLRNNPNTAYDLYELNQVLSPINSLIRTVGLSYGISQVGKTN